MVANAFKIGNTQLQVLCWHCGIRSQAADSAETCTSSAALGPASDRLSVLIRHFSASNVGRGAAVDQGIEPVCDQTLRLSHSTSDGTSQWRRLSAAPANLKQNYEILLPCGELGLWNCRKNAKNRKMQQNRWLALQNAMQNRKLAKVELQRCLTPSRRFRQVYVEFLRKCIIRTV